LGRQRSPIPCDLPACYWVFGRPVSTRNDDGSKPRALAAWRSKVKAALDVAINDATKDRGFELVEGPVEIRVIWLSVDPEDPSQPDLDNMLKPLIDALNKKLIHDDRQVHRILAEKASINSPPTTLRDIYSELQDDVEYTRTGEVIVVRISPFNSEYLP
jgi:Holliday junction resolvase RusA-like endonuclease